MAQFSKVYVKIINKKFIPMDLPVDYVWQVTDVIAKYVIANGDAILCDSDGIAITPPWPPFIQSAGVVAANLTLTYDQPMAITDDTGLTIEVDGVEASILSVVANGNAIDVTMALTVGIGTVVTASYDSSIGNIENDAGVPVASFSNYPVINTTA